MNRGDYLNRLITQSELRHHGVLGQKWGVRRTPEQLGGKPKYLTEPAILRAGSNVYRITRTKKEHKYADTFVFTEKDDAIKFGQELKRLTGGKLFMMDIQVTKDILGASEKDRVDEFLNNYKKVPAVKQAADLITAIAPDSEISLGVKGEDSGLLKYRAYSLAVAKNIGSARTYAEGGVVTRTEYTFGAVETVNNPKYGMVVDDYMRGNTKLAPTGIEIDSLDSAALIFAKTNQSSLKTKKVSKFKHSDKCDEILDLWPVSGGNSLRSIPLAIFKK